MMNIILYYLSKISVDLQRYIWEYLNVPNIVYFSMTSKELTSLCIEINEKVKRHFIFKVGQSILNRLDIDIKIRKIQSSYNFLSKVLTLFPLIDKIEFVDYFPFSLQLIFQNKLNHYIFYMILYNFKNRY